MAGDGQIGNTMAAKTSVEDATTLSVAIPGWREAFSSSSLYYHPVFVNGIIIPPPHSSPSMEQSLPPSSSSSSSLEVLMNVLLGLILTGFTLLTVLGNALVLHAVRTERKLQTVCNMFIVSLAVADLVVGLVVMPISAVYVFTEDWVFGVALCQLWIGVDYTASTASILNLLILSLDRYWSVTNPLKYLRKRTRARGLVMISVVWVLSSLWIVPIVGWHHFVNDGVRSIPSTVCDTEYARSSILKITTSILNFYLPLAIMYVLYIRIFVEIRRRSLIEECCERIPRRMESFSSDSLQAMDADPSLLLEKPKQGRFFRRPLRISFCSRHRQRSERSSNRKWGHFSCRRQLSEPVSSREKEVDGVCCSVGKTGGCGGELIAMERLRSRIYDRRKEAATASERTGGEYKGVDAMEGDERCEKVLLLKGMSIEEEAKEEAESNGHRLDDVSPSVNDSMLAGRKSGVEVGGEKATSSSPLSKEMWNVPEEFVEGLDDSDSVFDRQLSGSRVEWLRRQKGDVGLRKREGSRRENALLDCLLGQTMKRQSATDPVQCSYEGHEGQMPPSCEVPAIRNIKCCHQSLEGTSLSSLASSLSSRDSDCSVFESRLSLRGGGGGSADAGRSSVHRVRLPKEVHPVKGRTIDRSIVANDSLLYGKQNVRSKETILDHGENGMSPPHRRIPLQNENGHTGRYPYLALIQRPSTPLPTTDNSGRRKLKSTDSRSTGGAKARSSSSSSSLQKEIKAARQVGVIMGAFTVCFLPYFVCFTVVSVCEWCNNARLMTAVTWFGYLNSTLNPFLYPLCNINFRRKFRQMLSPSSAANIRDALPVSRQLSVRGVSRLQPVSRSRLDSILNLDRN